MAGEPTITVIGRLGADPEIRFTDNGKSVANCSVAVTPRRLTDGEWQDRDTMWFSVSLWRNAEDFVENARKGSLVVATGRFATRVYKTKDGEQRTEMTLEADGIGIMPATTKVAKQTDEAPW
jgi:single-strand DNA-binding protein